MDMPHMSHMGHMAMQMMPKWFTTYTKGPFLIEGWKLDTIPGLVSAMAASIILSIIYECVNYIHHMRFQRARTWNTKRNRKFAHIFLSLLRTFAIATAYTAMLCVMTFNTWILISVIVGSGVGHLVGRPLIVNILGKKQVESEEHTREELLHDYIPVDASAKSNVETNIDNENSDFNNCDLKLMSHCDNG